MVSRTYKAFTLRKIEFFVWQNRRKLSKNALDNNSNLLLNQLTVVESDFYNTQAKKNILQQRGRQAVRAGLGRPIFDIVIDTTN